jgi:hypothetical protein
MKGRTILKSSHQILAVSDHFSAYNSGFLGSSELTLIIVNGFRQFVVLRLMRKRGCVCVLPAMHQIK